MYTVGQLIRELSKYKDDLPIWISFHPSASICETDTFIDALETVTVIEGHHVILEGDY